MNDFKSKLSALGSKLAQSVSEGVASVTNTPPSESESSQSSDLDSALGGPEQQSSTAIKKTLQAAASLQFKLQRKLSSISIKFVAKHPPPLTVDLYFKPETISRILKQCEASHCYSSVQLAWLDSGDSATEARFPVPESETLLQEINQVSALLRSGDAEGAEELAIHIRKAKPKLRHPVISNCCFEASLKLQDNDFQLVCALEQLECHPFDSNAALVINQTSDSASLRGQVCRLVLDS